LAARPRPDPAEPDRADTARRSAPRIRTEALSLDEAVRAVSRPGAGGIATFVGVVRDVNDGRAVTLLEYEAYGSMAEAELARIEGELLGGAPELRVFATHRVGALSVGDAAVVCAASSVHRAEAFAACRRLVDEIKARLPIWKREHGPDGPYWIGWVDARCSPDGHHHGANEHGGQGHGHRAHATHAHGEREGRAGVPADRDPTEPSGRDRR
jgi:molybdopterin synthase catalytic subunit